MNGDESSASLAASVIASAEPPSAEQAMPPTTADSTPLDGYGEPSAPLNADESVPDEKTESETESDQQDVSASTAEPVATPPTANADVRSALEKQPYEFAQCTIQIAIQLLPHAGDAGDRPVIVGVRSHLDAPILQMMRLDDLSLLPPALITLLEQLKGELPAREQVAKNRMAKAQEETQRRAHTVKASGKRGKTASPKTEKATAPAPGLLLGQGQAGLRRHPGSEAGLGHGQSSGPLQWVDIGVPAFQFRAEVETSERGQKQTGRYRRDQLGSFDDQVTASMGTDDASQFFFQVLSDSMTNLFGRCVIAERRRTCPQKSEKGKYRAEVVGGGRRLAGILVDHPAVKGIAFGKWQALRIGTDEFRQIKFLLKCRGEFDDAKTIECVHFSTPCAIILTHSVASLVDGHKWHFPV